MNTELFIARRILQGNQNRSRLSRPIVLITLVSISLGMAIMLVTVSVVTGFQKSVREKVIGFGSHIQITSLSSGATSESSPVLIDQNFYPSLEKDENVRKIQPYALKPGILQKVRENSGEPMVDLQGVMFKGIDQNYDWTFFAEKLIEGDRIDFAEENDGVMISEFIAKKLNYTVGDTVEAFFIQEKPTPRNFTVTGIYRTGLLEFDEQFVFVQIGHVQKLNNWGVQTFLTVADTCIGNNFVLEARSRGGSGLYQYNWGNGFGATNRILLNGSLGEEIIVLSSDFERTATGSVGEMNSVPDTARARILIDSACSCNIENIAGIEFRSASEINMPFGRIIVSNGSGTSKLYASGFEVMVEDWDDLAEMDRIIYENIPGEMGTTKITDLYPGIFAWLDILDMNVAIVIVLILLVSLMNMVTSLLVLILEKTNMIGILKATGARNGSIRRIFTFHAMFLLSRGLLWGNILGLGFIALQYFTNIVSLNPDVYYLDSVPVNINILHIILINLLTILVCRIILILPSLLVVRILPSKAIRFN